MKTTWEILDRKAQFRCFGDAEMCSYSTGWQLLNIESGYEDGVTWINDISSCCIVIISDRDLSTIWC